MTDMAVTAEPSRFRVGQVFSRSFALLFGDFAKFVGLAAILSLPFLVLSLLGVMRVTGVWQFQVQRGLLLTVGSIILIVASLFSQAVMLYGAFQRMRGQGFAIGDSLKYGLARFFPIVGLMILLALAIGLASLVCIIPAAILGGILVAALHLHAPGAILVMLPLMLIPASIVWLVLYAMWAVALPVCVVEQEGPGTSFGRSRALTKGHRWKIAAILLLMFAVNPIVQGILTRVLAALAGPIVTSLGVFLWLSVSGAFQAIVIAVIYHDLRVAKDGIDIHRIAAVFD